MPGCRCKILLCLAQKMDVSRLMAVGPAHTSKCTYLRQLCSYQQSLYKPQSFSEAIYLLDALHSHFVPIPYTLKANVAVHLHM